MPVRTRVLVFVATLVIVRCGDRRFLSDKQAFDAVLGFIQASIAGALVKPIDLGQLRRALRVEHSTSIPVSAMSVSGA